MLDLVASLSGGSPISLSDSNYVPSLSPGNEVTSVRTRFRGLLHLRPGISDIRRGNYALT